MLQIVSQTNNRQKSKVCLNWKSCTCIVGFFVICNSSPMNVNLWYHERITGCTKQFWEWSEWYRFRSIIWLLLQTLSTHIIESLRMKVNSYLVLVIQITHSSSRPEVFCRKGVLLNLTKFTGKHLYQSLLFNIVAGATLLKRRLRHRCF